MTAAESSLAGDLRGRGVLVTGAARGIGLGATRRFAELGAKVTAVDLDGPELVSQTAPIEGARAVVADASDDAAMHEAFKSADGPIEVIIANAGVSRPRIDASELAADEWERIIRHNLTNCFVRLCTGVAHLREHGLPGRVIANASVAGVAAEPGCAAYAAAKWGVIGLVKSMAMEVVSEGIRINAVCPGDVDTNFLHSTIAPGANSGPIGRAASVEEIVRWFEILAGPAGDYMVGEAIVVDGGLSLTAFS